ncbi:glycosyltransferase [Nakamurella leprariae]|uniref:glycosyltransferase n=1 Tax=Nakamurella leprariae TaxID=2803911 RepID=UPI0038B261A3
MDIAMVSEHASPLAVLGGQDAGGQNVHVAELARALAARGHRVRVYTRRDAADLPERVALTEGVEVVHVTAGPAVEIGKDELLPHMPEFGRRLTEQWTAGPPDVVHAHFWMSGVASLPAARETRTPLLQTFHALGTVKRRHQGSRDTSPAERIALETELGRAVDTVVATCTDEVAELVAMGVPADRVTVVPCGVDVDHFSPGAGARGEPGRLRLLSVGRLVERKGVDTVLRALVELPDCELLVAGGPEIASLGRDPEAVRLRFVAAELGVADRVRMLGRVGHDDMPGLLRSADVVVATPWYEPFGIVPIEAAACGRPVVGSAVGGLLDTVLPGRTGLLVPPRDPAALAAAVRELAADPDRRAAMGRAARERAVRQYSWASVARATEAVYREVRRNAMGEAARPGPDGTRAAARMLGVAG